jgi:hypothetical protein
VQVYSLARVHLLFESKFVSPRPQFPRFEDSQRGNDAGDQVGRCDVEAGIARAARRIGNAHVNALSGLWTFRFGLWILRNAPSAEDFAFVAFFDRNVETRFQVPIDGGEGNGDVEGNFMARRQDRFGVGADFVRHFAGAAEGAVAADNDEVNFSALHQMAGGVVRNDLVRNFLLRQFPRSQCGALGTRSRFVAKDVKFFALRLGGIHRGGGAADVHEREPARVAVRENFHAAANQFRAVFANFGAVARVFVGEFLRGRKGERLLFLDGFGVAHDGAHAVHGVDGINGGGPGGLQRLVNGFDVVGEFFQVAPAKGARALGQAVGGGRADGSGAADNHVFNGESGLAEIARGNDFEFVRQQALLNEQHGILFGVEGDGAVMPGLAAKGDVHGQRVAGWPIFYFFRSDLVGFTRIWSNSGGW